MTVCDTVDVMATYNTFNVLTTIIIVCFQLINANNVCYVEESGCKFRVTVLPVSRCPVNEVNDQPDITKVSSSTMSAKYYSTQYNV